MSQYHALSEQEAVEYARNIPNFFPEGAEFVSREIGDGNLNLVFHISDKVSGKSLILKQALPYAKVVGESWPLTLDRARIESEVLLLEASLCPELVPHVYTYDPALALTVMEDLSDHTIMRRGLIEGNRYPLFAAHISHFLAKTLFYTSDLGLNQQEKKLKVQQFINPELCKITEDLIFDHPYWNAETNNYNPLIRKEVEQIWQNDKLQFEVAVLREKFLTHAQALLHGDLHTGSVFITARSTKVIDPEFGFYGPMGFDIGAVIANLLLNYAGQEAWIADEKARHDFREYLLETIRDIWTLFAEQFQAHWTQDGVDRLSKVAGYREDYMLRLLQDSIGFAGSKMIRRIIGLAHVADIQSILDLEARARSERIALSIGESLILLNRHAHSIEEVIDIAKGALTE
ncbi:S-methyl-5-thioribose kinase [Paenibacillus psychroresistens]|uniref:Methylthioribose kinase n=1 Tax=Paenibacillus psychroresistens TaxID=1778678 RepID=A0A6B8RQS3_9BACL|nr:S-methyl-5-thioribose kinase [Paenibacillus psychroresistens]QGQ97843.1 S-methyl-5-thioribose kinase [Paenibacillus psychroresistens]